MASRTAYTKYLRHLGWELAWQMTGAAPALRQHVWTASAILDAADAHAPMLVAVQGSSSSFARVKQMHLVQLAGDGGDLAEEIQLRLQMHEVLGFVQNFKKSRFRVYSNTAQGLFKFRSERSSQMPVRRQPQQEFQLGTSPRSTLHRLSVHDEHIGSSGDTRQFPMRNSIVPQTLPGYAAAGMARVRQSKVEERQIHTCRCSRVGCSSACHTLACTASAAPHSPVSCGGCQPERLTTGLNASSGGLPSVCA